MGRYFMANVTSLWSDILRILIYFCKYNNNNNDDDDDDDYYHYHYHYYYIIIYTWLKKRCRLTLPDGTQLIYG